MSRATPVLVVVLVHVVTLLLAEDGVSKPGGMKCVYAKLGGVSAGVRPPPAVDHTTVQYAGNNIRATQVS